MLNRILEILFNIPHNQQNDWLRQCVTLICYW